MLAWRQRMKVTISEDSSELKSLIECKLVVLGLIRIGENQPFDNQL